jgi:ribonuclease Z
MTMSKERSEPNPATTQDAVIGRRDALKALTVAASTTAMEAGLANPAAAQMTVIQPAGPPAVNPYGAPPGSGTSMPPYYRPTPSIRNNNNYFPQTEQLGDDEMRITFMGSNPFPPRLSQAGTCIMVECGKVGKFFFDFGPGCLKNIVGNQVPVAEVNDIFITHLHIDHYADLLYLWGFAPFSMRFKPLRVIGPSGRTPELGTKAMTESMRQMGAWHVQSFTSLPVGDGYEFDVTEFDYTDDGGVCYDKNGVTVRHWQRSHMMDGASAYRLDWNGLSFVWTGDGKPDELTAKYASGADVFVSEMVVDIPALWALKQGAPEVIGAFTIDSAHSPGYGVGYLTNLVNPRLGMATHFSFDKELLGEAMAEVRTHYKGMFAFGIDHTVVNVTKDAIWIREAALPDTANTTRPNPQWLVQEMFGGVVPKEIVLPPPAHTVADVQSQDVRDMEIKPEQFTPPDQIRKWVREWPKDLKIDPAMLMGARPPMK